jgi:hypothetical protein
MKANCCTWLWPQKKVSEILSLLTRVFICQRESLFSSISFPKPYFFTRIWFNAPYSSVFFSASQMNGQQLSMGGKMSGEKGVSRENERETSTNNNNNKKYVTYSQASTTVRMRNKEMWKHFNCSASLVSGQRENPTRKENFTPLHFWAHLLMHGMTCQTCIHTSCYCPLYVVHYITTHCYSYFTVLYWTCIFVNRKLSSTYGPFCMTNRSTYLTCDYS